MRSNVTLGGGPPGTVADVLAALAEALARARGAGIRSARRRNRRSASCKTGPGRSLLYDRHGERRALYCTRHAVQRPRCPRTAGIWSQTRPSKMLPPAFAAANDPVQPRIHAFARFDRTVQIEDRDGTQQRLRRDPANSGGGLHLRDGSEGMPFRKAARAAPSAAAGDGLARRAVEVGVRGSAGNDSPILIQSCGNLTGQQQTTPLDRQSLTRSALSNSRLSVRAPGSSCQYTPQAPFVTHRRIRNADRLLPNLRYSQALTALSREPQRPPCCLMKLSAATFFRATQARTMPPNHCIPSVDLVPVLTFPRKSVTTSSLCFRDDCRNSTVVEPPNAFYSISKLGILKGVE